MAAGSNSWRIQVCGFGTPAFRNRFEKALLPAQGRKWLPRTPAGSRSFGADHAPGRSIPPPSAPPRDRRK